MKKELILFGISLLISLSSYSQQTVSEKWTFTKGIEVKGEGATFFTDDLKSFHIRRSATSTSGRLQIGIAESHDNYCPGTNTGDIVLRKLGEGTKLIITNGSTYNYNPSIATGILASASQNGLWVHNNGNIRLGLYSTTAPDVKLLVQGAIKATEIKVEAQTADFVFEPGYQLRPLEEVESFILENRHLPEIPNAEQMEAEGVNLAEMNKLLLMKVEELTLYMIEQQKMINALQGAISKE